MGGRHSSRVGPSSPSSPLKTNTLALSEYDWLGFDLDHTLVRYNIEHTNALIFKCLCDELIAKGHSPFIKIRGYAAVKHLPHKGLVYDDVLGNFLLLSSSGKILKATHGTRELTGSKLADAYQGGVTSPAPSASSSDSNGRILSASRATLHRDAPSDSGHDTGADFEAKGDAPSLAHVSECLLKGSSMPRFHLFPSYFDMPIIAVLAHLVDLEDEACEKQKAVQAEAERSRVSTATAGPKEEQHRAPAAPLHLTAAPAHPAQPPVYSRIIKDILRAIYHIFNPALFSMSGEPNGVYAHVATDKDHYLYKMTPTLRSWLQGIRKVHGVKLFLLTNSHMDYANNILSYAYGPEWRDIFDLVVVQGQKPEFFIQPPSSGTGADATAAAKMTTNHTQFHTINNDHSLGHAFDSATGLNDLGLGVAVAKGNHPALVSYLAQHKKLGRGKGKGAKKRAKGESGKKGPTDGGGCAEGQEAGKEGTATVIKRAGERKKPEGWRSRWRRVRETKGKRKEKQHLVSDGLLRVMYCGDHPLGDIRAVATRTSWHTVAIVEEMLVARLPNSEEDEARRIDEEAMHALAPSAAFWGACFADDHTTTAAAAPSPPASTATATGKEPTLLEQLLLKHSTLIVPHLDTIAARPLDHKFRSNGGAL